MRCPRCDGSLTTFAVESEGDSAVVCESCGFADVPASHAPEVVEPESWERAVSRLDREPTSVEGYRTERTEGVPLPLADSTTTINSDRLDESVTVAATLRSDSGGTTDDDATADDATTEVSDDGTADGGTTDTPDGEVSATADGSGPDADGSGPDADGRETTSS